MILKKCFVNVRIYTVWIHLMVINGAFHSSTKKNNFSLLFNFQMCDITKKNKTLYCVVQNTSCQPGFSTMALRFDQMFYDEDTQVMQDTLTQTHTVILY